MSFESMVRSGIQKIYEEDYDSQLFYVKEICDGIRKIDSQIIFDVNGFFVPNDEYVKRYFPHGIEDAEYGMYSATGMCYWNNVLVLPVTNVVGDIVGLAGYNPFHHLEAKEDESLLLNYYTYSMKSVFKKGDFLYCKPGVYKQALHQGYLIITDGIFDTLSLTAAGYLSAALLGSVITDVVAAQLRFIKKIIVAVDNDEAGNLLFDRISRFHRGTVFLKQGKQKDADDILKTGYRCGYLRTLDKCISNELSLSYVFSPKRA